MAELKSCEQGRDWDSMVEAQSLSDIIHQNKSHIGAKSDCHAWKSNLSGLLFFPVSATLGKDFL